MHFFVDPLKRQDLKIDVRKIFTILTREQINKNANYSLSVYCGAPRTTLKKWYENY